MKDIAIKSFEYALFPAMMCCWKFLQEAATDIARSPRRFLSTRVNGRTLLLLSTLWLAHLNTHCLSPG